MTAACVFSNIRRLVTDQTAPVFFNGATSNIGKAVIIKMVATGYTNITFHTNSELRAQELLAQIAAYCGGDAADNIRYTNDPTEMWKFEHCVIGSSFNLPARPPQSISCHPHPQFIGFAFPLPQNIHDQPNFRDIGEMVLPGSMAVHFQALCAKRRMYSCFCGTATHGAMGWTHHEVGDIDVDRMQTCWDAALALGFSLPPLPAMTVDREKAGAASSNKQKRG
jgi:hypothetical protein